jgi:hypothetical protein
VSERFSSRPNRIERFQVAVELMLMCSCPAKRRQELLLRRALSIPCAVTLKVAKPINVDLAVDQCVPLETDNNYEVVCFPRLTRRLAETETVGVLAYASNETELRQLAHT